MTDPVTIPIVVHATPTQPQIEAAVRQFIVAAGPAIAILAGTDLGKRIGLTSDVTLLLQFTGPLAAVIAFVWWQYETRKNATKAATMATALPDTIATTK
jgi:hypothetical protein